jgi:hypothetical protein
MVIVEVLAAVLVGVLALATLLAMYGGLLGLLGVMRFVPCDLCGHLGMTSASEPLRTCTRCRHGRLLHPLWALHHSHGGHHRGPAGSLH